LKMKKKSKMTYMSEVVSPATDESHVRSFEMKEIIEKCLAQLPPVQKSIILLRDLEGYNYKEIGEILELSEAQVKVYLFRARNKIKKQLKDNYIHYHTDIRDNEAIKEIFKKHAPFQIIIHTAAQPSHDWAAKEPQTDFSVNALGTLVMLENYRNYSPEATFIFTSTNKVYGDNPNKLPLVEQETRYEIDPTHQYADGIDETMSLDHTTHSIFGASKVAADVLVQEYGKYFGLPTVAFRGGCLTGPMHSGTELHGFLAYLVKCISRGKPYKIFGYKGKQVRDNIHSYDLVNMFWHFHKNF